MAKRVSHFLLLLPGEGQVELQGPFRSVEERDEQGLALQKQEGRAGRVFWLDVDRRGMPTVGSFGFAAH